MIWFVFVLVVFFFMRLYTQVNNNNARGLINKSRIEELEGLCNAPLPGLYDNPVVVEQLWKMRFIGLVNKEFYTYVTNLSSHHYDDIVEMGRSFLIDMDALTAARLSKRLDVIDSSIFQF